MYLESRKEDYYFIYNGVDKLKEDMNNKSINYYSDIVHPSGIPDMLKKFLKVIEDGLVDEYDFIVRINSSTFLNYDLLRRRLQHKSPSLYLGYFENDMDFVSGGCIVFGKDTIKLIKENLACFNYSLVDDVSIGDFMRSKNQRMSYLERYSFCDRHKLPDIEEVKKALQIPHIRVRNDLDRNTIDTGIWDMIGKIVL
jgi:hypothetical protein